MKKPNENAYLAYNRYINGESVGDIAFDLDVSETTVNNSIKRVEEFEKWDSIAKITELDYIMHPNWLLAQQKFSSKYKGGCSAHFLYNAVLHIYSCQMHELFIFRAFGFDEKEFEKDYDVEINLYGWKAGTLTKYPQNVKDCINDMTILHLDDARHIIDAYDAVTDCTYHNNILRIKLSEKLKEGFESRLPQLKMKNT
ncbi:hypothetical protein SAMN05421493_11831 [Pseudobutyrivibrio sp. 49]|uniref:hypothetical protein n=1 Tax=Pseudobutyrivibrio sp. 49 TaxID=1855344 RepID=UPI00088BA9D6|nr:hypothetical protein [Pseudobutyrivibrio sp. 49]SDI56640.1 hypothetical protein SAMN05421493_11831 [Pseudobutyrivibrio sp. 49]